ncbi:MAG: peptide ABC transporter substrate-binding protein [Anaerolineaceae bacterium]|nr:MAG: peptide ABC transporter substrate-binding protein [Anaerolineaceae bacterium]
MTRRSFLLIFATAFLLLSCQLASVATTEATRRLAAEGVDRQDAVVLKGGQPRTLDPAAILSGPDGPLGHIFSGLVTLDPNLQVQPDLAAGWEVSEDGLVYTFYLRENATFHNGTLVTARDIIYSWERAADPDTNSETALTYLGDIEGVAEKIAGQAEHISGIRAIDDHTLEVRLKAPVITFLAKLAYPVTFVVDGPNINQEDWQHMPNGTGPFKLQTWRDDDLLILARNEEYYLEPAQVAHVVYDLGPGLPLAMYETGEIDLVGIGTDTLARVQDPNNPLSEELRTEVSMCTSTIGLNNRLPPFDDVRVRKAFNYALDKERLIETFSGGNGLVADGPLPPGMPGYGGLDGESYPYDLEEARQLLAEAGYADPTELGPLTFTTQGYGDIGPYITAVITLWQEALGVTVEPVMLEPFAYYDELYAGNTGHFYSSGWCADYPDPQNFLDILYHSESTQNLGGFADPQIDALLEEARTESDVNKRLGMYQEAERRIVQQAPVVFTSHGISAVLVSSDLQGYELTPIGVPQWHRVNVRRDN